MANSKRKGNKFELKVSKWFTKWTGYTFNRVPMSGAWHSNNDAASDSTCVDERHAHRCKISVECKSYKDIRFEHLLLSAQRKKCDILKFWNQAMEDGTRSKKVPILCMRYNSMPADEFFFVVDDRLVDCFLECPTQMGILCKGLRLYIFMASEVLNNANYKQVHKTAKLTFKP